MKDLIAKARQKSLMNPPEKKNQVDLILLGNRRSLVKKLSMAKERVSLLHLLIIALESIVFVSALHFISRAKRHHLDIPINQERIQKCLYQLSKYVCKHLTTKKQPKSFQIKSCSDFPIIALSLKFGLKS